MDPTWTHGDKKGLCMEPSMGERHTMPALGCVARLRPTLACPKPFLVHGQCLSPPGHPTPQGGCHTFVLSGIVEETNFLEVAGGGDRQGHDIADGLMEARVGPAAEGDGLVLVLQVVLDVTHLVVHREQLLHGHRRALLDPAGWKQSVA